MSDRNLRLSVSFEALDRLSGPIKRLMAGSKGLGREFKKLQDETKSLQRSQEKIAESKALQQAMEANHKSIDEMRRRARMLRMEMEQGGKPTKEMRAELRALESGSRKLSRTVEGQSKQLGKLKSSLSEAGVDVNRLTDEERRLGRQLDENNAKLKQQKDKLAQIGKMRQRGEKLKGAGDRISGAGIGASVGVTAPIVGVGAAAFKAAMDVAEMQSAFDVTFGKSAASARQWAEQTGNTLQRSTQEMQAMSMSYMDLFSKSMNHDQAVKMSKEFTVLTQDLASFKNLANETSKEKIFSGLIGEAEPLRAVGVMLSENAVKAKAMAMGLGKGSKELSESDKMVARAALIREQLANAQGDVIRTQDSTANRLKAASTAWDELKVTIGDKLLPKLTPVIDAFTRMLSAFGSLPPGMQSFIIWAAMVAALVGPILTGVGAMISIFGGLMTVASGLAIGIAPLLGIIALVAAGIAAAAYLIYENWDWLAAQFRPLMGTIMGLWTKLQGLFAAGQGNAQLRAFGEMVRGVFGSVVVGAIQTFVRVVQAAFGIIGGVIDAISALLRGDFAGVWQAVKTIFRSGLDGVVSILMGFTQIFFNVGSHLVNGLVNGLKASWQSIKNTLFSLAQTLPVPVQKALGIQSPSRVFMALGAHLTSGLAKGIDRTRQNPIASARSLASGVAAAGSSGISRGSALPASAPAGAAGRAPQAAGPTIVNVYGAPGQSVEELANVVIRKLEQAKGVKARSSYEGDR